MGTGKWRLGWGEEEIGEEEKGEKSTLFYHFLSVLLL